jgi:glucosyl-dolichyl phosphate glucuronosyltransferase
MNQLLISAIICTYNRDDLLPFSLESLCRQTLHPASYQIIIINNNCTDNTDEVVYQFQGKYPQHTIHLVHEFQQGLSHARNKGWQEATSPIVAYLDDDAKAAEDWLEQILTRFEDEKVLAVGGYVDVFYLTPKPTWFLDEYGIISHGNHEHILPHNYYLAGGNMAWRKVVFEKYGGFDTDKGVTGDILSLGEETWLMRRLRQHIEDAVFLYTPQVRIYHYVPPQKMYVRYHLKRAFVAGHIEGSDIVKVRQMQLAERLKRSGRKILSVFKKFLVGLVELRKYKHWENWAMVHLHSMMIDIGYILGLLNLNFTVRQR